MRRRVIAASICSLRDPVRNFVFDTSGVVFASALTIRGFLEDDPFLATIGLSVLAVFVIVEVAEMRARNHPPSERMRRVALGRLGTFDTRRARRFIGVGFALAILDWVVTCTVAAIACDWGRCLFYGVLATTGSVGEITARDRVIPAH